ncbi:hypothetical protein DSCA_22390 [Desulfosarcina alkanivorans]|uniref:Uncharacterized protein n=1 Tax=Desulfosarcina alkanivorans TaxID=571177 RepID=A0A5K7YKB1_9BACT|nr:acyl-CoA dehydrogenase family protein [Desulfosarcina alkanivorans]BBO68309.1 hypothetical protein DSCA_22390 [Desulfosarcina alkanivorans]
MNDGLPGDLLHDLLACPKERLRRPVDSHASWRKLWASDAISRRSPIERSIFGGFLSDRLAWAFASGYQGAIRQLIPALPQGHLAALCITESGGNRPRDIHTRLIPSGRGFRLKGRKQFVTGGEDADLLVVAACTGVVDGRNRIRMARVDRDVAGLAFSAMPPLPFVPEIRHSVVSLDDVFIPADRLLPGDGYAGYIKPFRTIEDLHVAGALLGYLLGVGRRFGWTEKVSAEVLALIALASGLAQQDLSAPYIHIAVDGLFRHLENFSTGVSSLWHHVAPEIRTLWQRDIALLAVAGRPRAMRSVSAWRAYP